MHADEGVLPCLQARELLQRPASARRKLLFTEPLARTLGLEATLRGHRGCVNRLAWSQDGTLLASGSDDRQIRIWHYPETARPPIVVDTRHQANLFGVRFLPCTNNLQLVSGAMDYTVQLHSLEGPNLAAASARWERRNGSSDGIVANVQTTLYAAHKGRIKAVEVEPMNPNLFWSASEDGTVRQFDKRCRTESQGSYECSNVLVSVSTKGRSVELKSLAINPARPAQMALAASDCFVRVYDRRMMGLANPAAAAAAPPPPALQLAPPHLTIGAGASGRLNSAHGTHASFGARGDRVIVTYHGDHAYSFDVTAAGGDVVAVYCGSSAPSDAGPAEAGAAAGIAERPPKRPSPTRPLPPQAEAAKTEGNHAFFERDLVSAISHYTHALRLAPWSSTLYANRAAALMARGWVGDAASALRDCDEALRREPRNSKAMHRRVLALQELRQLRAAAKAADEYIAAFPLLREDMLRVREALTAELEEAAATADKAVRRREHRKRQRQEALARSRSDSESEGGDAGPSVRAASSNSQPALAPAAGPSSAAAAPADQSEDHLRGSSTASLPTDALTSIVRAGSGDADPASDDDRGAGNDAGPSASGSEGASALPPLPPRESPDAGPEPDLWDTPSGRRLLNRYVGHCNCATDIKEVTFLGSNDELVACSSDDGYVFIYDSASGDVVRVLKADEDVVNCIQPHPHLPVLATSGIETVVRLWSPPRDADEASATAAGAAGQEEASSPGGLVARNQERMREGPQLLRGVNPRILQALTENPQLLDILVRRAGGGGGGGGDDADGDGDGPADINCRVA